MKSTIHDQEQPMGSIILRLSFSVFVISLNPGWCLGQTTYYSESPHAKFKVVFRDEDIAKTPVWKDDAESPPISARKALKLASAVKERLVKDDEDWRWYLDGITLQPYDIRHERWTWLVEYKARITKGGTTGVPYSLRLVVLMDGTVPEPTVTKTK